jgi:hypothetical protein
MKKVVMLAMALVLVLGTVGVAFAMWSDTLQLGGVVATGKVEWQFVQCDLLDEENAPPPYYPTTTPDYTCNPGFKWDPVNLKYYWQLDKNVAWGTQEISVDGKTLTVTLHNVYPCNFNRLTFYVANTGTIPIKVSEVIINPGDTHLKNPGYAALDFTGEGNPDFEIQYGNSFGAQIEPGGGSPEFSMWFHTLQACPGNSTFTFTISVIAVQWNEWTP